MCLRKFCTVLDLATHKKQDCEGLIQIDPVAVRDESTANMEQSSGPAQCEFCEKDFSNKSNLRFHQRNAHSLKYLYDCKLCDQRFAYKRQLVAHHSAKHIGIRDRLFECWLCHET